MPDLSDQFNLSIEKTNYDKSASLFKSIAVTLGVIGIIVAVIMLIVGVFTIHRGGFGSILGAIVLAIQSTILIIIGDMMYGLSRVALATLESVQKLEEQRQPVK